MTSLIDRPAPVTPLAAAVPAQRAPYQEGYPALFRRGHQYEISLGQRLALGGFKGPTDVAFGPDGWLYVMNRYPNDGNVPGVRWVVTNVNDDGYEREVVPMGPDGKPMEVGREWLGSLQMTVCDSAGVLYSADERRNVVVRCRTTGETIGYWGEGGAAPGQLNAPTGMCLDRDENVWIVNTRSHRVDRYTGEGKWLGGFGSFGAGPGQLDHPWGVAVDPVNGTLLVSDWGNNRVQRFTTDGALLQVIGRPGHGAGELHRPAGTAVDAHGDVYVADRGNNRVLMFNYRGMFIESFIGDAVINDRGMKKVLTNLDMVRMRENIEDLDREKRLKAPVSVRVDNKGRVYIMDTGRYRIQVYRKMCKALRPDEIDPPSLHVDPVLT